MDVPRAYLDTCILSRVVDGKISEPERSALSDLLVMYQSAAVDLFTSTVAEVELRAIPERYRDAYIPIYELFYSARKVEALGVTHLGLAGVPAANASHLMWSNLHEVLPDAADAEHAFVAFCNRAQVFLTVDHRTIINRRERLQAVSGLRAMTPSEFLDEIRRKAT